MDVEGAEGAALVAPDAHVDYERFARELVDPTRPWPEYRNIVDRTYARHYSVGDGDHDQYVHRHPNGLCVVGLAPSHPIVTRRGGVARVELLVTTATRGKKKAGALAVQPATALARVTCSDGATFDVRAAVPGLVLELNQRLATHPGLVEHRPDTEGFVAIIKPRDRWDPAAARLMPHETYKRERLAAL